MSEVQDELERILNPPRARWLDNSGANKKVQEQIYSDLIALFARHAEKLAIDPHDFVEPCEPDCSPERHAYHQGQWDMAGRIQKHLGYMPYPGAIDAGDKLKEPQE